MSAVERKIVVEHRKELSYLLCQAAEIEHMAMCQYLYAAFSLKTEPGPGITEAQLEMVERWRGELLRIAAEEMLHWGLVNNILTAIGSAPFVSRPNLPHRAKGYPPSVQFALLPFGETALRHFVYFERPQDADVEEVEEFAPAGRAPAPMDERELQPRAQDYVSQGDLYRALDEGLEHLAERLGEDRLFIGPSRAQAGSETFRWPEMVKVTNLETARTALVRIIEQGEGGSSQDVATAHYGRFTTILEQLQGELRADPGFQPAHPVSAALARTVEGDEPSGPLITNPSTAAVSDLFNAVNDLVLQVLSRYFAFGYESQEQLATLSHVSIELMSRAIKPLGLLLAGLPVGDEHPRLTAGANFQLAYRSNFLLPHPRAAWLRFAERLEESADFADGIELPGNRTVLEQVSAALRANAGALLDGAAGLEPDDQPGDRRAVEEAPVAPHIEIEADGPYVVHGPVPLRRIREVFTAHGEPVAWETVEETAPRRLVALCRCGGSSNKPYCDGTHRTRPWDPTETASTDTFDERAKAVEGAGLTIRDDRSLCSHAGFCKTRANSVWELLGSLDPDDTITRGFVMAMVERCPSGALSYRVEPAGPDVEPQFGQAVSLIEDGPLLVTGNVPIGRSDGQPLEARNRVVLCRCGQSSTKPLCDGTHKRTGFTDRDSASS